LPKADRFTSNKDRSDQRPILHISSKNISRAKMLRFVTIIVCNYRRGHISARPPGRVPTCYRPHHLVCESTLTVCGADITRTRLRWCWKRTGEFVSRSCRSTRTKNEEWHAPEVVPASTE